MTSIRGRGRFVQKSQAFEAPTNRSNNEDYKDLLGSNKLELFEVFIGLPQVLLFAPPTFNIAQYTQKDMNHLFQMFF